MITLTALTPSLAQVDAGVDYFETYVEPLLTAHCYECHSHEAEKSKGGLVLDSRAGILKGGDSGPAIDVNSPDNSLLITALHYADDDLQMPPDAPLSSDVIEQFREWIEKGAPHSRIGKSVGAEGPDYEELTANHWSLQPVTNPAVPEVKDARWPYGEIDRFVLSQLESASVMPNHDADNATLLRRLHFDLTGLPPTPEEVDAFISLDAAERQAALPKIVDQLLQSPHFGERWGRHWLDVARFAESNGKSRDVLMPHAWRYRNYVFDAFADGMPYDQFITEQIAGDLLPSDSIDDRDRQRIASGFLAVGAKSLTEGNFTMDLVDDQIDVVTQSVLGLTVACARCHDHKFDPIPTADYYALAGIFLSTETRYGYDLRNKKKGEQEVLLALGEDADATIKTLEERKKRIADLTRKSANFAKEIKKATKGLPKDWKQIAKSLDERGIDAPSVNEESEGTLNKAEIDVLHYVNLQSGKKAADAELKAVRAEPAPELDVAMGALDVPADKIRNAKIHIRGEPNNLGDEVDRGFLDCISAADEAKISGDRSGRVEFAAWLTNSNNPLTPRVAANRVWHYLFGRGLVATTNNFGINGKLPTHPELLDFISHRLVHEHDWSLKSLIREIVLSRSYQLSSALNETAYAADPENKLLWRMNRKRIEAEPLRDAILAASGELIRERPEFGSRVAQMGDGEVGRGENTKPLEEPFLWRGAYLPILRTKLDSYLKTFDLPEPSNPSGPRIATNVPAQALWLMNSDFANEQSKRFAERVLNASSDRDERIALAFRLAYARPPTATEARQLVYFLDRPSSGKDDLQRWTSLCQALYAAAEFQYLD